MHFKFKFFSDIDDKNGFLSAVEKLYLNYELRNDFIRESSKLIEKYKLDIVLKMLNDIYGLDDRK